jgi:peptidyl-prolyl cis-trans isomerase SurA
MIRLIFSLALLLSAPMAGAQVLDRIVAVVNEGVILQSELDNAMRMAREQLRARGLPAPPTEALRSQVLERLVLIQLQMQRAQEMGIRVDDRELNEVLVNIAAENGMSLAEFAAAVRADGDDYLAVREQIREEMMIQRLRAREVEARIHVTEQDIDLHLQNTAPADDETEVRLLHILVAVRDGAPSEQRAEARSKIESLRQRILDGEEFAQIASAHSDGQQALAGGDLDWRSLSNLPRLFAEQARAMKPGDVSPVLEATSGFHLVKLAERRGGEPRRLVTETRARHILLQPNAIRDEEATRLQARDIYNRLEDGASFEELTRMHSDDPGSRGAGGDLGWQPPGVFAPEFQIRIDQLQPGETSTPFRTQFGWHIARVEDRRSRDTTEQSRRARARQAIVNRRMADEHEVWLRRMRDEAYVEYRLGGVAAGSG